MAKAKTSGQAPLIQPRFDARISSLAFPLSGKGAGGIERGYMVWDKPIPGYSGKATVHYLYNPSTVSADYNIANPTVQAAMNFPIASDTSQLAIPLQQTANWTVMFDRTYEVNQGKFNSNGTVKGRAGVANDPSIIGVQADVMQMMQFTGMLTNYSYGTAVSSQLLSAAPSTPATNFSINQGIMQLVPSYAYFGNASLTNNTAYYGYITEWSVQYTDWTQYNVPYRCVIAVNMTMLPPPNQSNTGTKKGKSKSNSATAALTAANLAQANLNALDQNWNLPSSNNPNFNPSAPSGPPQTHLTTNAGIAGR